MYYNFMKLFLKTAKLEQISQPLSQLTQIAYVKYQKKSINCSLTTSIRED